MPALFLSFCSVSSRLRHFCARRHGFPRFLYVLSKKTAIFAINYCVGCVWNIDKQHFISYRLSRRMTGTRHKKAHWLFFLLFKTSTILCVIKSERLMLALLRGHLLYLITQAVEGLEERIKVFVRAFFVALCRTVCFFRLFGTWISFFRMDKTKIVAIFVVLCLATDLRTMRA